MLMLLFFRIVGFLSGLYAFAFHSAALTGKKRRVPSRSRNKYATARNTPGSSSGRYFCIIDGSGKFADEADFSDPRD